MPELPLTRRTFGLAIGAGAVLWTTGFSMSQTISDQQQEQPQKVSFASGDGYVVGNLYLPAGHDPSDRYPAVVIGGSLSSVKEQMGANYGRQLARLGIVALAIDYRNYGESGGAKRQFEDQASKSEDLLAALAFLSKRPDVTGTGIVGICTSGGTALYAAVKDPTVGAIATVAGYLSDPDLLVKMFGKDGMETRRASGSEARRQFDETGIINTIPTYMPNDPMAVSSSPSEYYMDETRGGGVRPWRNEFAVMGWEPWLEFNPVSQASHVTAPTLMIHSDGAAFPDQARKVHDLLGGPKELHWTEGKHFDFYDDEQTVRLSAERLATFFRAHLL